jgi:hypothetical protein
MKDRRWKKRMKHDKERIIRSRRKQKKAKDYAIKRKTFIGLRNAEHTN